MQAAILFFVLFVVACTLIGFLQVVVWLVRLLGGKPPTTIFPTDQNETNQPPPTPQTFSAASAERDEYDEADETVARAWIAEFFEHALLDRADFNRLNDYLDRRESQRLSASPATDDEELVEAAPNHDAQANLPSDQADPRTPQPEIVTAEIAVRQPAVTDQGETLEPWDYPDPEPAPPRRTLSEVLSGFMEERNMRWGELTSGILIVLSAVGLVVSLRDELSDRIPYFSSLLFLMITAAVHLAGIYTLKKWKLKNTSRGTLIIGLLLVPINFLAACILNGDPSDREPITSPYYWIAIGVGGLALGSMTFWSSRLLFRKRYWPILTSLLAAGGGTLLLNRTVTPSSNVIEVALLSLPVMLGFIAGTTLVSPRQWSTKQLSGRVARRVQVFLGLAVFAAANAIVLVGLRSREALDGLVSMLPLIAVAGVVTSWIGWRTLPAKRDAGSDRSDSQNENALLAVSLQALGAIASVAALVSSISHPSLFSVTAILLGLVMCGLVRASGKLNLVPWTWLIIISGALALFCQASGRLPWNQWVPLFEIGFALVSAPVALFLLGSSLVLLAGGKWLASADRQFKQSLGFHRHLVIASLSLLLVGSGLALIASLLHRKEALDVTVADGLLMLSAMVASIAAWQLVRLRRFPLPNLVPNLAAVFIAGSLAHLVLWDPRIAEPVAQWIEVRNLPQLKLLPWLSVTTLAGFLIAALGRSVAPTPATQLPPPPVASYSSILCSWSALWLLGSAIGTLFLVSAAGGWATILMALQVVGWWWNSRTMAALSDYDGLPVTTSPRNGWAMVPFLLSTLLLVVIGGSEFGLHWGWLERLMRSPHLLLITAMTSLWSIAVVAISLSLFRSKSSHWLGQTIPVHRWASWAALGILVIVLGDQVIRVCVQEIYGDWAWAQTAPSGSLMGEFSQIAPWAPWLVLALVGVSLSLNCLESPDGAGWGGLIFAWLLAWGFGAVFFQNIAAGASAVRWLVPIGGLLAAIIISQRQRGMIPWALVRSSFRLPGRSSLRQSDTQRLVELVLAAGTTIVLLLSTLATAQVLLNAPNSLGGPLPGTWLRQIPVEVRFGVPVAIVVSTYLVLSISERCQLLASVGSTVFQFIVVTALFFLAISPYKQIASRWFIGILQAVSIGMTVYGLLWYRFRNRIAGFETNDQVSPTLPLQLHTIINGLLITGMAAVMLSKVFWNPEQSAGWINSFGSWFGIVAWLAFIGLAILVWREELSATATRYERLVWSMLAGWGGLMIVAIAASTLDRWTESDFRPWSTHKLVTLGLILTAALQALVLVGRQLFPGFALGSRLPLTDRSQLRGPLLALTLVGILGIGFAWQGAAFSSSWIWIYLGAMLLWTCWAIVVGLVSQLSLFGFGAAAVLIIGLVILERRDPQNWISPASPALPNLIATGTSLLAITWSLISLRWQTRHRNQPQTSESMVGDTRTDGSELEADREHHTRWIRRQTRSDQFHDFQVALFPNTTFVVITAWLVLASFIQMLVDGMPGPRNILWTPTGLVSLVAMVSLLIFHGTLNPFARFRTLGWTLASLAVLPLPVSYAMTWLPAWHPVWILVAMACAVTGWGIVWLNRKRIASWFSWADQRPIGSLESSARIQLPIYSVLAAAVLCGLSLLAILFEPARSARYGASMIPCILSVSFALQSNDSYRRWCQWMTLALVTTGAVFVSWAELSPEEISRVTPLLVRLLIVLGALTFIYGSLISRWVRITDRWLESLRQAASVICGLAVVSLVAVVSAEAIQFVPDHGCGTSVVEATGVAMVIIAMIVGLLTMATVPQRDPFSLPLAGRMAYVYIAQLTAAGLVAHLFFSMPWLFQFGLRQYWPFIVMLICFTGVGVAQVLQQRRLEVLALPLFNTATILPVLVAALSFLESRDSVVYDPALVMLVVGGLYLMVCYLRKSVASGAAFVLFGNAALWLMLHKFPAMAFVEHPQLWLIPPAASVLIGAHLIRDQLSNSQLTAVRYLSCAIIYVSSTSEIFIRGIGESLWPPMVLTALAVAGILAGMLLRIKSFLYLGSVFLLMAMLTMVSHAHRRFDHVWPWWAFGIGLGIAILVMFGLFEKRKQEVKRLAAQLRQWQE